jgi:hypothetical protein
MGEDKSSQIEKKEPEIDREDFRMLYQITIEDQYCPNVDF